ncbi:MAG TPA: ATP-binding protein [Aggregatilineales bacterium]|nr:hypothetical protein [Anaerolineales bacterium]HRE48777.1 ATP-binding protein [Aggregatilineales bacterium]
MAPNVLTLFAEPSVVLLYFMSVIVLSCAALFMALGQRMRSTMEKAAGRYALAAGGVAVAWLLLMVGAVVVLLTNTPSGAVMPPLDRAVGALVVALVGWVFLVADRESLHVPSALPPNALVDEPETPTARHMGVHIFTLTVLVGVCFGYGLTAAQWYNRYREGLAFTPSSAGILWTATTAALAGLFTLAILWRFRKTPDAPLKVLFFAIILAGYLYTLISLSGGVPVSGDDSGAIRLAFLAAMPLLPVAIYRMVVERLTMAIHERAAEATVSTLTTISNNLVDTTQERESMTLLRTIGVILEREAPEDLPRQVVIAACSLLKADVCALLVVEERDYADVIAAYDASKNRHIAAMAFKLDEQPTLQTALIERSQRMLTAAISLSEITDVYSRLDIQTMGPVYFQPLTRDGEIIGALLVAMPYTQRDLRQNEKRLLDSLAPIAARMVGISRAARRAVIEARQPPSGESALPAEAPSAARLGMQQSLESARAQINALSGKVRELQIELDFERSRLSEIAASDPEGLSISQRMERIQVERSTLEAERERLMQALQEAQTQLATVSGGGEEELYKTAIELLTQERDELYMMKEQLEGELAAVRSHNKGEVAAPAVLKDMLTRLSEEKSRLTIERDHLRRSLMEVNAQLAGLGIDVPQGGLVGTIMQISEERGRYKEAAERAIRERNLLIGEFNKFKDRIVREKERDARIATLENALKRMAQDGEVLMRQRDVLSHAPVNWEAERMAMAAELDALKADLDAAIVDRNRVYHDLNQTLTEKSVLIGDRDRLMAARQALQTERDQLAARIEGNRELLNQLGADGVGALKKMIDHLTEERSELEHKLLNTQKMVTALREKVERQMKHQPAEAGKAEGGALDEETAAVLLSVAQELRTPLNAITAYIDLLLGETVGILGELQRQFLQRVKANGDRLATLIEDFVRVVAIDTGQLRLKEDAIDMNEIIEVAITNTRTQFREKGITLNLDLAEAIPPLRGDRGALTQVIVELLSNAYRASPTDSEVTVKAALAQQPLEGGQGRNGAGETTPTLSDVILIAVQDTGGGVAQDDQGRVFSRFHRADMPLVKGLGDTGVGLSVAKALTEAHQGRLWLESKAGESSTFLVALPLAGQAVHAS